MSEGETILDEALRIEEDTEYSGRSNFEAAVRSDRTHLLLGAPAAVLAAAAGATILADVSEWIPAACAAVAAVLGALQTFVRADKRAAQHHASGAEFIDLRNEARIFRTIDYPHMTDEERRQRSHELSTRRSDLNRSTPRIPRRAFEKARHGIEAGEASYEVDRPTLQ